MRTTLRVDDDLLKALKERALQEDVSLTRLINRLLRVSVDPSYAQTQSRRKYRETVYRMGQPSENLDKALALSTVLEDEETARRLKLRK